MEVNLQNAENNLVRGLPSMSYKYDLLCDECQKGKQIKNYFTSKNIVSTFRPLQLLHLNLFGPSRTASTNGKTSLLISSLNFVNVFKMKNKYALLGLEVTMGENLKWTSLNCSVKKMKSFPIFQHQERLRGN